MMAEKEFVLREDVLWLVYSGQIMTGDNAVVSAQTAVKNLPAADVRPVVRGKWVKADYEEDDWPFPEDMFYLCSNCTTRHGFVGEQPNFCPNCGADMRGEQDEEENR